MAVSRYIVITAPYSRRTLSSNTSNSGAAAVLKRMRSDIARAWRWRVGSMRNAARSKAGMSSMSKAALFTALSSSGERCDCLCRPR
jgi:hypothetical protein